MPGDKKKKKKRFEGLAGQDAIILAEFIPLGCILDSYLVDQILNEPNLYVVSVRLLSSVCLSGYITL